MAVLRSFFSCFHGMLLRYVLNDSKIVTVATIITGNTPVPHSLLAIFLLHGLHILESSMLLYHMSVSRNCNINMHARFPLSRILLSGLLFGIDLSGFIVDYILLLFLVLLYYVSLTDSVPVPVASRSKA